MPDSEGTWQIGVITGAAFAATDFGQYSPAAAEDTWAAAVASVQPVAERATIRAVQQLVELAAGERSFTLGILFGASRELTAGAVAAETAVDGDRIRRPAEVRCTYDGGVTTGVLYPRLAAGTGSDVAAVVASVVVVGTVAMRLVTVVANCLGVPGDTDLVVEVAGVAVATASTIPLATGVNIIDFLGEAGAHTITAGGMVGFKLDCTDPHGVIGLLLQFEEVPL